MAALKLEIVTPAGAVLSEDAEYVGIPGVQGQLGVMPGHIPLFSALAVGELYCRRDGQRRNVFISGGFAEVFGDKVSILAETAERSEEIDVDRAKRACERAKTRLAEAAHNKDIDVPRAQSALLRAMTRLDIASQR